MLNSLRAGGGALKRGELAKTAIVASPAFPSRRLLPFSRSSPESVFQYHSISTALLLLNYTPLPNAPTRLKELLHSRQIAQTRDPVRLHQREPKVTRDDAVTMGDLLRVGVRVNAPIGVGGDNEPEEKRRNQLFLTYYGELSDVFLPSFSVDAVPSTCAASLDATPWPLLPLTAPRRPCAA